MILEWIRFGLCAVCLITAMICFTAAVLGANRFGFIMNRLHAAGIGDTLGLFLVAVSIIIGDGFHMQEIKMLMILVFMTFTSPVSSHFLTQLEYFTNPHLYSYVKRDGLDEPDDTPGSLNSPESGQEVVSGRNTAASQDFVSGRNTAAGQDFVSGRNTAAGQDVVSGRNAAAGQEVVSGRNTAVGQDTGEAGRENERGKERI